MNNRVGMSRTLLKPFLQFCVIVSALAGAAQAQTGRLWVTADFNGDNKADVVTITASEPAATGHTLRFAPMDAAAFALQKGLSTNRLIARDIDGDTDRDLVLETAFSEPIAVWLNDGAGNFVRGNLEDYRFQLSHQSPQTVVAMNAGNFHDPLDDSAGQNLLASALATAEVPESAHCVLFHQESAPTVLRLSHSSRGPPLHS